MPMFTMVRQVATNYKELQEQITKLEKQYKKDYKKIYQVLQAMAVEPIVEEGKPMPKIGYKIGATENIQSKKSFSQKIKAKK